MLATGKLKKQSVFNRFMTDESGSASIEAMLWIPLFAAFLILITDVSFMFFGKAQALRIAQDANRAIAMAELTHSDQVEARVLATIQGQLSPNAVVDSRVEDNTFIVTTVTMPAGDLMPIGSIGGFADIRVIFTTAHYLEK